MAGEVTLQAALARPLSRCYDYTPGRIRVTRSATGSTVGAGTNAGECLFCARP
jgi:hypothetical protein